MLTKLHVHAIISKGVQCDQHHTPSDRNQLILGSTAALSLIAPLRNCKAEIMNEKEHRRAIQATASQLQTSVALDIVKASARKREDYAATLMVPLIYAVKERAVMAYLDTLSLEDQYVLFRSAIVGLAQSSIEADRMRDEILRTMGGE